MLLLLHRLHCRLAATLSTLSHTQRGLPGWIARYLLKVSHPFRTESHTPVRNPQMSLIPPQNRNFPVSLVQSPSKLGYSAPSLSPWRVIRSLTVSCWFMWVQSGFSSLPKALLSRIGIFMHSRTHSLPANPTSKGQLHGKIIGWSNLFDSFGTAARLLRSPYAVPLCLSIPYVYLLFQSFD